MDQITSNSNNQLFAADKDWWNNACVNFLPDHLSGCAEGYKEAADILVTQTIEQNLTVDRLIYPILFLYRHYLEIRLKSIIKRLKNIDSNQVKQDFQHNLKKLWKEIEDQLRLLFPDQIDSLKEITNCIEKFSEVDPASMTFRYAELPSHLKLINIKNIYEQMQSTGNMLEGINLTIIEYIEVKKEEQKFMDELYSTIQ
jgi:hypothetical protein